MSTEVSTAGIVEGSAIAIGTVVKKGSGAKGVVVSAAATTDFIGVVGGGDFNTSYPVGESAPIVVQGSTMGLLAGTVAFGTALFSNASGLLVATKSAGDFAVGYALEAGVTGDLINIVVNKQSNVA